MKKPQEKADQSAPALKQPKTRLSKDMREVLLRHMNSRFLKSFDGSKIAATLGELVRHVNSALRAKFPEEDLIVFRRYEQASAITASDLCPQTAHASSWRTS